MNIEQKANNMLNQAHEEIQLVENREWKTVTMNGKSTDIPKDWLVARMNQVAEMSRGKSKEGVNYVGLENIEPKTGRYLKTSGAKMVADANSSVFEKGDVLYGKLRPYLRKSWVADFNGTCSTEFLVLKSTANSKFIHLHLLSDNVTNMAEGASEGTRMPRTNWATIGAIEIPLPNNTEQTLITQVLTAQESQVHGLRKLAALERQRLAWWSDELLSGRLRVEEDPTVGSVVVSRNEKGEPEEVLPGVRVVRNRGWRMVEINGTEREIPEEWKHFNLGSVATFSKGKGLSKKALIENGSNECIHYGELFTKYGSSIDTIRSKTDTPTDNMALSKAGDILMPTSDVTPTGLATASSINQEGVILGGDILIIRPNLDEIHPPFLSRVIREEKSQVMGLVSGSTVYHIYAKDMKLFSLILPPLPEQTLIAQVLTAQETQASEIERLADLEQKRLEWLSDELLSGRIRVKPVRDGDNQELSP